ncbi:hypothetical protein HRI_004208400 [Hibiscus trionum]|uniref:BZIP domain-containing protein n=1 Tax=Hibiscus trionum TaxID=183268 RepID=A0A9W7IZU5_HIBTR|nr:hypothetical protein HRI_004208400 [Hibiscus trionum]
MHTLWPPNPLTMMNGAERKYMNLGHQPCGSNFLRTQPDGPDLSPLAGSQLNQVPQVQIDTTMEDSVQTTGNQKSAAAIRSQIYREKRKGEMETLKNENQQLMNEIEKLKAEKVVSPSLDALLTYFKDQFTAINTRLDQVNSRLENMGLSIQSLETKVEGSHNEWMASISGGIGDDDFMTSLNSTPFDV